MKDYSKCREWCEKAIQIGQEHYADFKIIAKIYLRLGNSYVKEEDYENAVEYFNRSLTEHRSKEALNKLRETERIIKDRKIQAYIDPEKSLEEKEK
eukprot:Pgem_evm1s7271